MENGPDNIIFVGGKPFMNYVTAVVMQFTSKGAESITVKARGKFIVTAVDLVEVCRKRFLKDMILTVKDVKIDSAEFINKEGNKVNVSTIDIVLSK